MKPPAMCYWPTLLTSAYRTNNLLTKGATMANLSTITTVAATLAANQSITKKAAAELVTNVYEIIAAEIAAGNDVKINNVGTIKQVTRAARTGHNPSTGDKLEIPAKRTLKFKPFANIKVALNS